MAQLEEVYTSNSFNTSYQLLGDLADAVVTTLADVSGVEIEELTLGGILSSIKSGSHGIST